MNNLFKYSGILAISVSLIMLSIGSIPQTYAGSVASTMSVNISCGMTLAGTADFGTGVTIASTLTNANLQGSAPTIENNGVAHTPISVNAGVRANTPPATGTAGGYAGVTDNVTHIQPAAIQMKIGAAGPFSTLDDAGTDVSLGALAPNAGSPTDLNFSIGVTGINGPITDPDWAATYTFTAGNCFIP